MPRTVVDIDRGMKRWVKYFRRFKVGPSVTVGIQSTEAVQRRKFGETNVTLALVHEFGSRDGRIPQRSFMRAPVDRERKRIQRLIDRAARKGTSHSLLNGLGVVGEFVRGQMIRTIDQSIGLQALKPSTERRKKSTTPLVDTGQLKNSITYVVHKR